MTKKQLKQLKSVLGYLVETREFILQDNIALCRKGGTATTTLHCVNSHGDVLYEIDKHIGSKMCNLYHGIRYLENIIKAEEDK